MAKNKTNNNDLFKGFNPTKLNTVSKKKDAPAKEEIDIIPIPVEEPEKEDIKEIPTEQTENHDLHIDTVTFGMPRSGRPKTLNGKYHNYTARLRDDLYEFAKTQVSTDGPYQSVNDYLNQLIAKDMLSKERK